MVGINIKTGVDKLVEIVSERKKISVDEAAKKLGVGKEVVQEWAEFLEEEGIVTIEYSLSKIWITEKKITKEDVVGSAKEISSEKDALARKIDVAISALDQEATGFEDVRKEFFTVQSHIKTEIDIVKKQLGELERYDSLKRNLDADISKQKQAYVSFVYDAEEKLKLESQKYEELKNVIEKERKNLEQYGQKLEDLRKLRTDYERTLSSLKESLKNIDLVLVDHKKKFENSSSAIEKYRVSLDSLEAEISEKKDTLLQKKLAELKLGQEKLFKNQANIERELGEASGSLKSHSGVGEKIHAGFEGFFSKNIATEKLISEIENDKTDMKKDLELLKSKVLGFTLLTTNNNIKSELKDVEEQLRSFERKKLSLRYNIEKLVSMFKGK